MLYDIVEAKPKDGFMLWVRFEDGTEGEVDLSGLVGRGVFKRWEEDPSEFGRATVDGDSGTVVWPGGLDVAPDAIYEELVGATLAGKVKSQI